MRERLLDEKDREAIGLVKRALEYDNMIPGFADEIVADPQGTLDKYGIPLRPEDITFMPRDPDNPRHLEARFPDSKAKLYADFVNRKFASIEIIRENCDPAEPRFSKWRSIQMGRCMLDLGPQYQGIIHSPLTFELSKGCSIGCKFCGLSAGPLQQIFRYTDENAVLWKNVLAKVKELLGDAAGEATLYFATEPFDNPDYELFKDDFKNTFGNLPQITTAASDRSIERLRPLIKELNEDGRFIYRLSLLSEEMFHMICEEFTPEELTLVELLPQYTEAPANHFAQTGRNEVDPSMSKEEIGGGTISCITGFVVNMCTRSVTLTTPTWSDKEHPNGQFIIDEATFTDAADLISVMKRMIDEHMKVYLEPDDVITTYPFLTFSDEGDRIEIKSDRGTAYRVNSPDEEKILGKVFELVQSGCYTRREIVTNIVKSTEFPAVQSQYLFFLINKLWSKGIFIEKGGLYG